MTSGDTSSPSFPTCSLYVVPITNPDYYDSCSYWRIPYTFNGDTKEVTFGEAEEVDIITTVVAKAASSDDA